VIGDWLLVIGDWLLVIDYWLLLVVCYTYFELIDTPHSHILFLHALLQSVPQKVFQMAEAAIQAALLVVSIVLHQRVLLASLRLYPNIEDEVDR